MMSVEQWTADGNPGRCCRCKGAPQVLGVVTWRAGVEEYLTSGRICNDCARLLCESVPNLPQHEPRKVRNSKA